MAKTAGDATTKYPRFFQPKALDMSHERESGVHERVSPEDPDVFVLEPVDVEELKKTRMARAASVAPHVVDKTLMIQRFTKIEASRESGVRMIAQPQASVPPKRYVLDWLVKSTTPPPARMSTPPGSKQYVLAWLGAGTLSIAALCTTAASLWLATR